MKDGAVVLSRGYGVRDLATREKVTPATLFSIASATKTFTATVAAMAAEEKRIAWDAPLKRYLPGFRRHDPAATEKVTLRDLLTRRSGVSRQKLFSLNPPDTRRGMRDRMRSFEPSADFRAAFQYRNETCTVEGDMVAERLGASWEELVTTRLLEPLGMRATLLSVREMQKAPDYATPFIDWGEGPEEMAFHDAGILGPAGEIVASANDLSKWLLFDLARGQREGKRLVDPAQLARIQSPQVPIPRPMREKEILLQSCGMGWFLDAYRGLLHVHHGGALHGFSSHVSFLPQENLGLVVETNLNGTPFPTILEGYVYDHLLGLTPTDWNGKARAQEARVREEMDEARAGEAKDPCGRPETRAARPLEACAGTYRSDGYGTIVVRAARGVLEATLWNEPCTLKACGGDGFDLHHPVERRAWRVTVQGAPGGAVASFVVAPVPGSNEIAFSRE